MMRTLSIRQQAYQVKNIANDLNYSAEILFKDHIRDKNDSKDNLLYSKFSLFNRQLITLHAYLDDLLEQLEWRHQFRRKLKRELGNMSWFVVGAFLGMLLFNLLQRY